MVDSGSSRARIRASGILILILAGWGSSPVAAGEIEVYGRAHLALNYLDDGDDYSAVSISSNSSRIGVLGSHPFTDHLEGVVQFEGAVDLDATDSDFSFSSRNAFAGFRGDWGLVRAGRFDTPLKRLQNAVSVFRDRVGDSRNVARNQLPVGPDDDGPRIGFDSRFDNAIGYTSPATLPVVFNIAYSTDTQEQTAVDSNKNDAVSASLAYDIGLVYAAIAHERWNFGDPDFRERHATRLAAYHQWSRLRVNLFTQFASRPDDRVYGVSARYNLQPDVAVMTKYYFLDGDDSENSGLFALGAEYDVHAQLRVYTAYAQVNNSGDQQLVPWAQGTSLAASDGPDGEISATGERPWALAVGAIYTF